MTFDAAAVNDLIRKRRSVFPQFYTGERVDDSIIRQMLVNASYAPTHKLTQPWRFVVFKGEGIEKFATAQAEVYKTVTERDGTFREEKYQSLLNKPLLYLVTAVIGGLVGGFAAMAGGALNKKKKRSKYY